MLVAEFIRFYIEPVITTGAMVLLCYLTWHYAKHTKKMADEMRRQGEEYRILALRHTIALMKVAHAQFLSAGHTISANSKMSKIGGGEKLANDLEKSAKAVLDEIQVMEQEIKT